MSEQAKRLDHITRALRTEAPEAIAKKYSEQVAEDLAAYKVRTQHTRIIKMAIMECYLCLQIVWHWERSVTA